MKKYVIPKQVKEVCDRLYRAGEEAYLVGGCVRDLLRGLAPSDWDVTTSALPERVKSLFDDCKTIDTGILHGTVTVLLEGMSIEVTTYRSDGVYLDGRHPVNVTFQRNLQEDLARRDFTMNAIAYYDGRIIDPFGGIADLQSGVIRGVGDPEKRMGEDALRILRALRFAATFGFQIEAKTEQAIVGKSHLVRLVAPERVRAEFSKLLLGEYADSVIARYREVLSDAIEQNLPEQPARQAFSVDSPACRARIPIDSSARLAILPKDLPVRLAALGELDLVQLRFDRRTIRLVSEIREILEKWTKREVPSRVEEREQLLFLLRDYSKEAVRRALWLMGESDEVLTELLQVHPCYEVHHLAIRGDELDLPPGPEVGAALSLLLDAVIRGKVANQKEELLLYLKGKIG